jgi:hypothetical protein
VPRGACTWSSVYHGASWGGGGKEGVEGGPIIVEQDAGFAVEHVGADENMRGMRRRTGPRDPGDGLRAAGVHGPGPGGDVVTDVAAVGQDEVGVVVAGAAEGGDDLALIG